MIARTTSAFLSVLFVALTAAACGGGSAVRAEQAPRGTQSGGGRVPPEVARRLGGHPGVVTMWASWCDACKKEFGALNRLARAATARDAVVVGVAVGDARPQINEVARLHRLEFPQIDDESFAIADALGERSVPTTLVVDARGNIVFRGGALDDDALRAFDEVTRRAQ